MYQLPVNDALDSALILTLLFLGWNTTLIIHSIVLYSAIRHRLSYGVGIFSNDRLRQ
jgi:hypothetical protein